MSEGIYERVTSFCREKGITNSQFESLCGRSCGYVNKLKTSIPGAKAARRMAQVMGITVDELLGDLDGNTVHG